MVTLPLSPVSNFTIGVDFGTRSARAVVVDVATGRVIGSRASEYAHGVVDDTLPGSGVRLPPDWALHDRFGEEPALMHDLCAIRNEALTP